MADATHRVIPFYSLFFFYTRSTIYLSVLAAIARGRNRWNTTITFPSLAPSVITWLRDR
jgi:hypothetical protein